MQVEPIEFQFALNTDDLLRGTRAFCLRSVRFRAALIALTLLALAAWIVAIQVGRLGVDLALVLTVTIAFLVAYRALLLPWTLSQQMGQDERVRTESTWKFSPDRITITNQFSKMDLSWANFSRILETDTHYLFVYASDKNLFQLVPKRAIPPQLEMPFRRLIAQRRSTRGFVVQPA
jgi:YcxB-like protein